MRTATANFLALNDDPVKNPVWIMIISGLPDNRGKFASGDFVDIDADYKKHIQNISLHFNKIDVLEPHTDANEYQIEILDKDLAFTNVMKDYNLYGETITIKIGFAELAEADFVVLPTVTIERIALQNDHLTWTMTAKDDLFKTKQKLFTFLPSTNLSGNIAIGASTITVDDTTGFRDPSTSPAFPSNVLACIVIDQELKSYTGISGNSFTGCTTRGVTGDVAHNDNAPVKQAFAFNCQPIIAALHVLTTTPDGTNGFYDLGIEGFGLGIPADNFLIENIEKTSWRITSAGEQGQSTIHIAYQEESLAWIERTCLRPVNSYFFSNNGKIDVGAIDYVWYNENFASDSDFSTEEIVDIQYDFVEPINLINLYHGKRALSDDFRFFFRAQLDDGITEYVPNLRPFEQFLNDGQSQILTGLDPDFYFWLRRLFDTYGDSFAKVRFETIMRGWLIEPGDEVRITYDQIPELITGTRGWINRRIKILGQDIDFSGKCSFIGESWQILDRVAGLTDGIYTLNEVEEGDIDDTALAFNASETGATDAEDAYYDNTVTNYEADNVVFFVELEEPGTGTGEQFIRLRTFVINGSASIVGGNSYSRIRYNPAGSTIHTIPIYSYLNSDFDDIATVKIDWSERSSSAGDDQPTLTLKKLWFIRHNRVISEV